MSDITKRLDLQFGSFACSVQGFDDPVQPVQQILQALQNLLEETPELGDSGISFDAAAIERLMGEVARRADLDEKNIEIVPGLIIIHRTDDRADGYPDSDDDKYAPFAAAEDDDLGLPNEAPDGSVDQQEPEDENPGYVNIFSPSSNRDVEAKAGSNFSLFHTATDEDDAGDDDDDELELTNDPVPTGLGRIADADDGEDAGRPSTGPGANGPIRDIFAEIDSRSNSDDGIFADLRAEIAGRAAKGGDAPIEFFTADSQRDAEADDVRGSDSGNANLLLRNPAMPDEDEPEDREDEPVRGSALFGEAEDQPDVAPTDDGYTAVGIAQTAGAEGVTELMVSAAAWMVLIQGQTTFSRSDVVDVYESMPGTHDKSLEARVRGFGKALRNGQFVKVDEGVFGLSREELERFQRLL